MCIIILQQFGIIVLEEQKEANRRLEEELKGEG